MKIKSGFNGERSLVVPKVIVEIMDKDPLASLLHITDIGYYPRALHHYRRRNPPIDQYVFIYCIDGYGWYELNGSHHRVGPNQFFILPAGIPHTYGADDTEPWTIYWAHFRGAKASCFVDNDTAPHTIMPGSDSRIANRLNLFEEIFNTLNDSFAIENIRYAVSAFHHFLESLRYFKPYRRAGKSTDNSDIIESVKHFMEENLERRLTLNDIAAYSGLSPSYLSAAFKQRTGHSPINYFNLLKIRAACRLLDTTQMNITQISHKLGFDDNFYFSRLFSKTMGLSPKSYRSKSPGLA